MTRIPRVPAIPSAAFRRDYLQKRKPVILTGLFRGQPIESVSSLETARRRLGDMRIVVRSEYFGDLRRTGDFFDGVSPPRPLALGGYLDLVRRAPRTRLICTELATPPEVRSLFEVPEHCAAPEGGDRAAGVESKLFVGNRGNVAHLHFDWDHRHVLLCQVFGRKRIVLLEPAASKRLNPVLNFSLLSLETMPRARREKLLRDAGAVDGVLGPGDALYMPPLVWHHIEYLDTAMSFNLRFGQTGYGRFAWERLHPNMHLQNVSWQVLGPRGANGAARRVLRRIVHTYRRPYPSAHAKYRRMQRLFEELYAEVCPADGPGTGRMPHAALLERQVRSGIARGFYYPEARRDRRARLVAG